ncbi:MAG: cation:proton antiporter subunit C [Gammaproteobacteria bacterium]|nr:cation:proton antiporter subunit C [Gammaproteobacteria bacterium]
MDTLLQPYLHLLITALIVIGLYVAIAYDNLIKKLVGLGMMQTAVFIFFISASALDGGTAPILAADYDVYGNPLPHVLILTAIVVNVSITAVGLALIIKIKKACGSLSESMISKYEAP